MHDRSLIAFLLSLTLVSCFDPPGGASRPSRHPHGAPDIYVRVAPVGHGSPAWVLERVHGNPFVAGELALYAAPGQSLGPHRLGALPLVGRGFVLWPGLGSPLRKPTSRKAKVPSAGGPWRGLVAELRPENKYLAALAWPLVPQSPGPRIITASMHYCHAPTSDACMTWVRAVEKGYVWCETLRGRRLPKDKCRNYVPDSHWFVDGLPVKAWEK